MTQQPRTGQGAPATDFGSPAQQNGDPWTSYRSGSSVASGQGPGFGSSAPAPSHADAPTASVPVVTGAGGPGPDGQGHAYVPGGQRDAATSSPPRVSRAARARGPRRARLQLRHINPWTVLKFSAVLSIALFFVWMIVVGVLFGVLDGAGIIGKINDAVTTINGPGSKPPVTATVVFGGAAIIGIVNIILFIALSTIGSIVYNLCADLVGGIEITLSER